MYRKIEKSLLEWKNSKKRKPLLLSGARQTGKTYILEKFCKDNFDNYVYINLDKEENPALGYRAIRICLTQKEIFKTQLRALFRAAKYGNLAIMYPMITSVSEVEQIKQIVAEVEKELKEAEAEYSALHRVC